MSGEVLHLVQHTTNLTFQWIILTAVQLENKLASATEDEDYYNKRPLSDEETAAFRSGKLKIVQPESSLDSPQLVIMD